MAAITAGIANTVRAGQEAKASSDTADSAERTVTDDREEQPEKAPLPTLRTVEGRSTAVRPEQPEKAPAPTDPIPSKANAVRALPWKEFSPTAVTDAGRVTEARLPQPAKASEGISVSDVKCWSSSKAAMSVPAN